MSLRYTRQTWRAGTAERQEDPGTSYWAPGLTGYSHSIPTDGSRSLGSWNQMEIIFGLLVIQY